MPCCFARHRVTLAERRPLGLFGPPAVGNQLRLVRAGLVESGAGRCGSSLGRCGRRAQLRELRLGALQLGRQARVLGAAIEDRVGCPEGETRVIEHGCPVARDGHPPRRHRRLECEAVVQVWEPHGTLEQSSDPPGPIASDAVGQPPATSRSDGIEPSAGESIRRRAVPRHAFLDQEVPAFAGEGGDLLGGDQIGPHPIRQRRFDRGAQLGVDRQVLVETPATALARRSGDRTVLVLVQVRRERLDSTPQRSDARCRARQSLG